MLNLVIRIALAVIACPALLLSQPPEFIYKQSLEIGFSPAAFAQSQITGKAHVFCLGRDAGSDGIFDSKEDEPPSWHTIEKAGEFESEKVAEFEFMAMPFPLKMSKYNISNPFQFALPLNGKIKFFNYDTFEPEDSIPLDFNPVSVDCSGPWAAIGKSPDGEEGVVIIYNLDKRVFTDTLKIGGEIGQVLFYGGRNLAVMCRSEKFGPNAQLCLLEYYDGLYYSEFIDLGGAGYFMRKVGASGIVAAINSPHKLVVASLESKKVISEIPLGGESEGGPAEFAAFFTDKLYFAVTTYSGEIKIVDYDAGEIVNTIYAGGSLGGALFDEFITPPALYVAKMEDESGNPENEALVFELGSASGTGGKAVHSGIKIYPNPASQFVRVDLSGFARGMAKRASVYSLIGEKLYSADILPEAGNHLEINLAQIRNLSSGKYILKIESAKDESNYIFTILK